MVAVLVGDMGALAVLDSIRARNSQMDAIRAIAAERIVHGETLALLKPVFGLIDRAAKPRNKLAHCVWGTIPQLPDALLLCEPKAMLKVSRSSLQMDGTRTTEAPTESKISFEHGYKTSNDAALALIKTMRDGTEVWRQADFNRPRALLDASIIALAQLTVAISGDPLTQAAAQARAQLVSHLQKSEAPG